MLEFSALCNNTVVVYYDGHCIGYIKRFRGLWDAETFEHSPVGAGEWLECESLSLAQGLIAADLAAYKGDRL